MMYITWHMVIWTTSVHFLQSLKMFIHFIMCNIRKLMVSVAFSFIRTVFKSQETREPMVTDRSFPRSQFSFESSDLTVGNKCHQFPVTWDVCPAPQSAEQVCSHSSKNDTLSRRDWLSLLVRQLDKHSSLRQPLCLGTWRDMVPF